MKLMSYNIKNIGFVSNLVYVKIFTNNHILIYSYFTQHPTFFGDQGSSCMITFTYCLLLDTVTCVSIVSFFASQLTLSLVEY